MKKRFLAVILALVMCVGLAPTAFAADSDFVIENGVLTKYNGPGGEVVIPDGVVCIGNGAFKDCTSMTSVIIPDSVTGIGYINKYSSDGGAFEGCTGLTSITIPDGVTNLTDDVFRDCTALTSITLPVSVEWFTVWLFSGTGLTDIYYAGSPEQWKQIGLGDSMQGWGTIGYPYDPTYGVLLDPFDCLGLVGDVTIHYNSGGPQPSVPAQPEQKPSTPAANKPAPGVSVSLNDGSGEFIYTIKSGDTLSGIAAYYYGDADVYKLIFERNKDVLKSASAVYAGQAIILPSYAAVAASKAPAQPEQKPAAPAVNKPAPGVSVSLNDGSGEFIYTIKYGDTLSGIAAYYYGDANVYKLIFERNKDVLKSASTIYAGQAIILPSYAAVAAFQAAK